MKRGKRDRGGRSSPQQALNLPDLDPRARTAGGDHLTTSLAVGGGAGAHRLTLDSIERAKSPGTTPVA